MKKYRWVITSILLVTVAQVLLRLAMHSDANEFSLISIFRSRLEILYLFLGLFSYILSLLSWTRALRSLSLSQAYPLLSISYILVWVASLFIPNEQNLLSWQALLGLGCIVSGVCLIVTIKKN